MKILLLFILNLVVIIICLLCYAAGAFHGMTLANDICLQKGLMYYDSTGQIQYTEIKK